MYYFISIEVCVSKPAICCMNYKGLIVSLTFKISRDEACFAENVKLVYMVSKFWNTSSIILF